MAGYLPLMHDIASQLCNKWERLNADDEIDVVHDMTALALDTIGVCGFDYRFNSFYRRDYHPFIDALTRTLETCMVQRGLPFEKVMLRKRLDQLKQDVDFMSKLVDDIVRERRRGGGDQAQKGPAQFHAGRRRQADRRKPVGRKHPLPDHHLPDRRPRDHVGPDVVHALLPGQQSGRSGTAYEEVDRVLGTDIGVMPTIKQVNQLTYVQQILNESLRLYPTAPAIGLYPYKDEVIGGKYKVKKGTFVTLLTLMLHRDPRCGGRSRKNSIRRIFRARRKPRPPNAFKPWGNGQRACIGRQFAMQEATLVMGMLLQRFQLFDHKKYQLKIKESLSIKPDGFTLKVKLRPGRPAAPLVPGCGCSQREAEAAPKARKTSRSTARRPPCSLAPTSARRRNSRATSPIRPNSTALT
jgi:cytochrome P450/NADPH-cytochrome P450 reductase